jgi:hypothetical protein
MKPKEQRELSICKRLRQQSCRSKKSDGPTGIPLTKHNLTQCSSLQILVDYLTPLHYSRSATQTSDQNHDELMQRENNAIEDSNKDNRRNKHTSPPEPFKNKTSIQVSSTIELEECLRLSAPHLSKIPLISADCPFGSVTEKQDKKICRQPMTRKERRVTGTNVTVLSAIRRSGCGTCREHGFQLTKLVKQERVSMLLSWSFMTPIFIKKKIPSGIFATPWVVARLARARH